MSAEGRVLAVALHDIEPATFERCALIRDWLADLGVHRVTLLVIPARDLHPLAERSPEVTSWLLERQLAGDAIAQHGFRHVQSQRAKWPRQAFGFTRGRREEPEFLGLDVHETRRAVDAGWRVLKLAGIEPGGFVAPAYVYTPALRGMLSARFRWWAGMLRVHARAAGVTLREPAQARVLAPVVGLGTGGGSLRRRVSPVLLRAGGLLAGETLRIDLYPGDVRYPRHMLALQRLLERSARDRRAVTYDELFAPSRTRRPVARHSPPPGAMPPERLA
jgi:uncharacterized protein